MRRPELVSVIVPVRDAADTLPSALDALAAQQYEGAWELVIADNGSRDGSAALATKWRDQIPGLRVVDASGAPGACRARNIGARAAQGDLLAFVDADDQVATGWLAALTAAAPDFDLVGGRIDLEKLNPSPFREFDSTPEELPVALNLWRYVLGGNCAIWRSTFEQVGGWNEEYRQCTDIELSWRVQRAGYRLGYAPDALVHYRVRASSMILARQFRGIGVAEAKLYRDFRGDGVRRDRHALKTWIWLAFHVPHAVTSLSWRRIVIRRAARHFGRLQGGLRERVFFP